MNAPAQKSEPPSHKLLKAGDHFRKLAERMDDLQKEVVQLEEGHDAETLNLEEEISDLQDQVGDIEDERKVHQALLSDLNDVRLGIRDFDEIVKQWDVQP